MHDTGSEFQSAMHECKKDRSLLLVFYTTWRKVFFRSVCLVRSETRGGSLYCREGGPCRFNNFQKSSRLYRRRFHANRDVLQNENCNFRKGPGTRCEKNGACSRISTRKFVWTAFFANKFFVSRSDFREVNPVVQLVQNGGSVGSFRSTGFASIFFPSRFGLR